MPEISTSMCKHNVREHPSFDYTNLRISSYFEQSEVDKVIRIFKTKYLAINCRLHLKIALLEKLYIYIYIFFIHRLSNAAKMYENHHGYSEEK